MSNWTENFPEPNTRNIAVNPSEVVPLEDRKAFSGKPTPTDSRYLTRIRLADDDVPVTVPFTGSVETTPTRDGKEIESDFGKLLIKFDCGFTVEPKKNLGKDNGEIEVAKDGAMKVRFPGEKNSTDVRPLTKEELESFRDPAVVGVKVTWLENHHFVMTPYTLPEKDPTPEERSEILTNRHDVLVKAMNHLATESGTMSNNDFQQLEAYIEAGNKLGLTKQDLDKLGSELRERASKTSEPNTIEEITKLQAEIRASKSDPSMTPPTELPTTTKITAP